MSPIKQRIAIALACGFKQDRNGGGPIFKRGNSRWLILSEIPDYLNDLNAIAEAERHIWNRWTEYERWLGAICYRDANAGYKYSVTFAATSVQRAEAFLRTLGLWKEE